MIFAIDPGNEQSAFVVYTPGAPFPLARFGMHTNETLLLQLREWGLACKGAHLAIEMIASYGMPVGREVFDTCVWIGRFIEAWRGDDPKHENPHTRVYRRDVKMHLCGNNSAKDGNIRQALIDRFGPGKDKAIGKKKSPGPLFKVAGDVWAALAVAVTFADGAVRAEAEAA